MLSPGGMGGIAACAAKITLAECAGVPLECLSPLGKIDNSGQLSYVWMGTGFSELYYDLFPRATGSLAAGAARDIGAQCQSGNCTSRDSCGSCVDESKVGEACGPTALCMGWRGIAVSRFVGPILPPVGDVTHVHDHRRDA